MLQEIVDSISQKTTSSQTQSTGIAIYKCQRAACEGYAFSPHMPCTICHQTVVDCGNLTADTNLAFSNGVPPYKQPRLSRRQTSTPILILSVGKAGIFDARHGPCVITASFLTCHVKVEGCWHMVNIKPSDVQTLVFCEELQVLFLKPRDTLKQSLSLSLKLTKSSFNDKNSMKWIILVLGDRMANSSEGNVSVQQMELFASAVRESDGFCKMDCTLMETRKLLLECGLRLPRAEARLQTSLTTASSSVSGQHQSLTFKNPQPQSFVASQTPLTSKSEGGLLTTVLNTLSSAGMHLFTHGGSNGGTVPQSSGLNSSFHDKSNEDSDENDDIIILSEECTDDVRPPVSLKSNTTTAATTAISSLSSHIATGCTAGTPIDEIFKFDYQPPGSTDIVTLTQADLECLEPGALLNDAIINFYLKYLYFEQLTDMQRHATYLFNSFFYCRLASLPGTTVSTTSKVAPATSRHAGPSAVSQTSINRHANVAKWTRRVDLFCKDYIIIPINEASHWFLGLVCYPWMAGMVSYTALYRAAAFDLCQLTEEFLDVDRISFPNTVDHRSLSEESIERRPTDQKGAAFDRWRRRRLAWLRQRGINAMPCILLFDSLPCQTRVANLHVIRDYLQVEWDSRRSQQDGPLYFNKDTIRGFSPRVPSQSNLVDCGIYLLHYVEMFFKQPVQSYTKDYFQNEMASWFTEDTVSQKRTDIRALLTRLNSHHRSVR